MGYRRVWAPHPPHRRFSLEKQGFDVTRYHQQTFSLHAHARARNTCAYNE